MMKSELSEVRKWMDEELRDITEALEVCDPMIADDTGDDPYVMWLRGRRRSLLNLAGKLGQLESGVESE